MQVIHADHAHHLEDSGHTKQLLGLLLEGGLKCSFIIIQLVLSLPSPPNHAIYLAQS